MQLVFVERSALPGKPGAAGRYRKEEGRFSNSMK